MGKIRHRVIVCFTTLCISACIVAASGNAYAQADTSRGMIDSLAALIKQQTAEYEDSVRETIDVRELRNREKYQAQRLKMAQEALLNKLQISIARTNAYLRKGIDTSSIARQLKENERALDLVTDGIYATTGMLQTDRNLTVSSIILAKLGEKAQRTKKTIDAYTGTLYGMRGTIDSLSTDSILYIVPADSTGLQKYMEKQLAVSIVLLPIDSTLNKAIANIENLQFRINLQVTEIQSLVAEVEHYKAIVSSKRLQQEIPYIWGPVVFTRKFGEVLDLSIAKNLMALRFYASENTFWIGLVIVLIALATVFLKTLKTSLTRQHHKDPGAAHPEPGLPVKYPILTAIVIVINPLQFIFIDTPFIFNAIIWLISVTCLIFITWELLTPFWRRFWSVTFLFFVLGACDNLILQGSRSERWYMFSLSLLGIIYNVYALLSGKRRELVEKNIIYFIGLVALFETCALLLNSFGRYNLGKTFMTCGFISIVIGVSFFWTLRLINEGLTLASLVYKQPHVRSFYINFNKIGKKAPVYFYILMVVGWFILVARNFYAYTTVSKPFNAFLTEDRTIGDYSFSIKGIFVFLLIMLCSMFLSRVISYFAADHNFGPKNEKKPKTMTIGSYMLLVRIFIICLGIFLAFAASGIPLDRITIIIGALGVGIGFGMQGLVSNLISGLIIAFEKPVNVGDMIELDGKVGTMRSIGFRASIITMLDGASLVVPNSDLLGERLTNWTMSHNLKRLSVVISIAYGTDIGKALAILASAAAKDSRVLKNPPPLTFAKDFSDSAIELELFFWTSHIREFLSVRGSVLAHADIALKDAGITIPFPQRDVWLRNKEE